MASFEIVFLVFTLQGPPEVSKVQCSMYLSAGINLLLPSRATDLSHLVLRVSLVSIHRAGT